MVTSILTDHDDFKKARRALIVSSVILIALTQMHFQSQFIEFFGLKLGVDPVQIIWFAVFGTMYFNYIFSTQIRARRSQAQLAHAEEIFYAADSNQMAEISRYFESYILDQMRRIKIEDFVNQEKEFSENQRIVELLKRETDVSKLLKSIDMIISNNFHHSSIDHFRKFRDDLAKFYVDTGLADKMCQALKIEARPHLRLFYLLEIVPPYTLLAVASFLASDYLFF